MNTAFETGGIFTIEDRASAVLNRLAQEFGKFDDILERTSGLMRDLVPRGIGRQLLSLQTGFTAAADAVSKAGAGMVSSMDVTQRGVIANIARIEDAIGVSSKGISASLDGAFTGASAGSVAFANDAILQIGRVTSAANESAAAVARIAAAGSAIVLPQLPSPPGGGGPRRPGQGGHGGTGGGPHFSSTTVPIPGGHVRFGGTAALAAAGVMGYAAIEEAETRDAVARIMLTSQLPVGKDMMDSPQAKMIREVIQKGASTTGFSTKEVGDALLGTEREFQGLDFSKRMEVLGTLMPYAGGEARLKETGLKESFETLVGLMHMSGGFSPEQLPELARSFSFASMATPSTLPQFANALSYSMPTLHAGLGMDPSTVMFLTSMMQTAGVKSTKSGTWLRSFFQKAEPDTDALGPLTKSQVQHNEALKKLGLIDDQGHGTWQQRGADGSVDWMSSVIGLSKTLNTNLAKLPVDDRLEILHKGFGMQGEGFATIMEMKSFVDQLPEIAAKMKSFKGGDDVLKAYGEGSTVQQARETWRDTQNVLMDIGTTVLPAVNAGLSSLDKALKALPGDWETTKKMYSDWWSRMKGMVGLGDPAITEDRASRATGRDWITPKAAQDFFGNGLPLGFSPMSFSNDNASLIDTLAQGVAKGLALYAGGGSAAGLGGGGGGITNASYTTFGSGGGGASFDARPFQIHGGRKNVAEVQDHVDFIRRAAGALGISPDYALKVAGSEGLYSSHAGGDYGTSFGDFQMHYGGSGIRGMNASGLGDLFNRVTGLDGKDPKNWRALDLFALQQARKGGWSPWHGAAHVGIYGHAGMGLAPVGSLPTVTAPPRTVTPGAPASESPSARGTMRPTIINLHLDGKLIKRHVVKDIVADNLNPRSVGGADRHGQYQHPGTDAVEAA